MSLKLRLLVVAFPLGFWDAMHHRTIERVSPPLARAGYWAGYDWGKMIFWD